ncbi:MAG: DUF2318 domain-containing protein [Syntrophales bacterium]|nr:DUF2318 domain-containing protein [Syntrophales bacterium]
MKKIVIVTTVVLSFLLAFAPASFSFGGKAKTLTPLKGSIEIPVSEVSDGVARFYSVQADDGIVVSFFVVKSQDNVIRAAINACDVCYRAGKGYKQKGDYMVCQNCGQRFPMDKINVLSGGCNPAPLARQITGDRVVISMKDINENSWYAKYDRS